MMLITIRRNALTNRFHPFLWIPAPLSGDIGSDVVRYKSKAHHTTGFETLEAAQKEAREAIAPYVEKNYGSAVLEVDEAEDDAWQADEVPASVLLRPASAA